MAGDALDCLLGMEALKQCDQPSVIEASWVLTSDGKRVAAGVSGTDEGGDWTGDAVSREIGTFKGEARRRYVLDVDFLRDGKALAAADPHLKVEVNPGFYEQTMFTGPFLLRRCEAAAIVGLLLLGASGVRFWMRRRRARFNVYLDADE
jgi:hypothetical protein